MGEKIFSQLSVKRMRKQMQLLQQMQGWQEEVAGQEVQEVETVGEDRMVEAVAEAAIAERPRWARC